MKTPRTYFSTEFHGSNRAIRARIKNLLATGAQHRGAAALLLLLAAVAAGGACLSLRPAPEPPMAQSTADLLAALPDEAQRADEGRARHTAGEDGALWYLFTRAEEGTRGGGVLKYEEDSWLWVWPAEGGSAEYAAFWSGHLGFLDPAGYSIELLVPLNELWAPDRTEFFYEAIFGGAPAAVQAAAAAYTEQFSASGPVQIRSLEPQGRYVFYETPYDVYRLEWKRAFEDRDASVFYDQTPAYLVLARSQVPAPDDYNYLGGVEAPDQINAQNAAIQVVYGVSNAEYTFTRDGYPGYCGLGGSDVRFFRQDEAETQVIDTNGDAIYGVGDYWDEMRWDGLTIRRYVNVEYGYGPSINTLATTRSDMATYRGVRVGMTREEVLGAYPEASAESFWDTQGDFLWWSIYMDGWGPNLVFHFKDDLVSGVEAVTILD